MIRTTYLAAAVILGSAAFSTAHAADKGVYLGAAISQASVDVDLHNGNVQIPVDGDDTKFKIIGGIRPLNWLAFEVNYVDFGSIATPSNTPAAARGEFKLKGFDAFAVGLFEIVVVDIYAKAGLIRWDQKASIANVRFDDSGSDMAYGGGVQLHFGSLGVRAEYEKFNIENTKTSLISVGVTWTFL